MRVRIRGAAALAAVLAVVGAAGAGGCSSGSITSGLRQAVKAAASPTATAPPPSAPAATTTPGLIPTDPATSAPPPAPGDFSAGRSTPVPDDVYPQYGEPAADVLHYGLDLKWDPTGRVLTGTATLTIRAARATDHYLLDFSSALTVDSLSVNGKPASGPARVPGADDKLSVPLGSVAAVDSTATVVVAYHGTPQPVAPPMTRPDIAKLGAAVTANGSVWAQQEPYGAFTWFPCNDQPSDKALYDVTITAPDGWAGVTGGSFVGRTESAGQGVYKWHQPSPVATYLVAFSVDKFQEDTAVGPHGLPITYWYLPADAARVHQLTAKVPQMISFLEQRFGPYPFPTAGVLFRPEEVGMETTTMITLGTKLPEDDLLHEFAHQWFGDAVTPKAWTGMWLNEGFAMYAQLLWDQSQYMPSQTVDQFMTQFLSQDQMLRDVDGPPGHYKPTHFASSNVYIPPALMLNKIRDLVGDQAFFSMCADWVHKNFGGNQDRAGFIAFAGQHTGRDLAPLINAWLDSATTPQG